VDTHEVKCGRGGTLIAGDYIYFNEEMKIVNWEEVFFVHNRKVLAFQRVEVVSERM
jgi:hypothetical protein